MNPVASRAEVRLDGVTFRYRGSGDVLRDLSVSWGPGVNVLLGLNGAGKTTLLKVLATALEPRSGYVEFLEGGVVARSRPERRERIGYLPQTADWRPRLSVTDFLHYFAWCRRVASRTRDRRVAETLEQVGLAGKASHPVRSLSGGQYRRLLIGQAIVHEPSVLVLDEPSVGLDPAQRARLRRTVQGLSADRVVIFSTHVMEDVVDVAQRITVLSDARIAFDGLPLDLAALGLAGDVSRRMEEGFLRLVAGTGTSE